LRDEFDSPIFLNADHTHSLARAIEAANAGFDAVVFDLSALPLEENARQTKEAVEALKAINPAILVEGEIGDIGSGSEIHADVPHPKRRLSTAEEAQQFVESTGIDILAPAVDDAARGVASRKVSPGGQRKSSRTRSFPLQWKR
jgi:fructose-bisphosphate aldolase class II